MANAIFTDRNGKARLMPLRYAELLQRVGRGTFRECDNPDVIAPLEGIIRKEKVAPDMFSGHREKDLIDQDKFENMDRDQLLEYADLHEIKIDRRWGDEKIRAELREQNQ